MNDYKRREVMTKFGGRCAYCGTARAHTVDHVRPQARGGAEWSDNLVPACAGCNNAKANMTLEEFREALFRARFNLMPHKKTAQSSAGRRWLEVARRFAGVGGVDDSVVFWFERWQG